jgi:hypothetical protein
MTAEGVFPERCVVEIACGGDCEPEVWMPALIVEVMTTAAMKGGAVEKLKAAEGRLVSNLFLQPSDTSNSTIVLQ